MSTASKEKRAAKRRRLQEKIEALDALDELDAGNALDATAAARARTEMLKRLIDVLLPADLKRNGSFRVTRCETTPGSNPRAIYERIYGIGLNDMIHYNTLAIVEFTFCDYAPDGVETAFKCYIRLSSDEKLVFHCMSPGLASNDARWAVELCAKNNVFEERFHKEARAAHPAYRPAFGTTPAWCYILLSMLVYTDHVFDSADNDDYRRVQHAFCESHMDALLKPFWDATASSPYPFLVRLMPPEFALSVNTEDSDIFR